MKARSNKREELFTTKKKAKKRNVEKKGFHRNEMACPLTYDILKENAKANRMKMTDAERALWEKLKDRTRGVRFRRQHIIGDYIVDFACLKSKNSAQYKINNSRPSEQFPLKTGQTALKKSRFLIP